MDLAATPALAALRLTVPTWLDVDDQRLEAVDRHKPGFAKDKGLEVFDLVQYSFDEHCLFFRWIRSFLAKTIIPTSGGQCSSFLTDL